MNYQFITVSQSEHILLIQLNRPDKCNAMHGPMVAELLHAVQTFSADDSRLLMLSGKGEHFCAGGDIAWMVQMTSGSEDKNAEDAQLLADLLYQLYSCPKPTLALVQGAVRGGGLGLVGACDFAIAAKDASFALPEVKIGITPSIISPYVIAAIGERAAHYYFLTGESFDADRAKQLGLVQQVIDKESLTSVAISLAQIVMKNSPLALTAAKQLIRYVAKEKITQGLAQKTGEHLSDLRRTPQAQEGLQAFIEKRHPHWSK